MLPPGKADRSERRTRRQSMATERTGTNVPAKLNGRRRAPNGLKLSDRHRRRKGWKNRKELTAGACSLERVVRPPAYRGASGPPELRTWTPAGEGGCCRRDRLTEAEDEPEGWTGRRTNGNRLDCGGAGTRVPSKNTPAKPRGLTLSSSATGTGDARLDNEKRRQRRCLFAGARG